MARLTYCRLDKLLGLGFFADREAGLAYVAELEALHREPGRGDLAWRLGIDEDVMDQDVRQLETRRWLERLVLPAMGG
jgi:GMP synthase (glutamine-hydrolysing)